MERALDVQGGGPLRSGGDLRIPLKIPQSFFPPAAEFREAVQAYIRWCEVLFTIREAVKLPLMWKLWSHKEVKRLRKTTRRPEKPSRHPGRDGAA